MIPILKMGELRDLLLTWNETKQWEKLRAQPNIIDLIKKSLRSHKARRYLKSKNAMDTNLGRQNKEETLSFFFNPSSLTLWGVKSLMVLDWIIPVKSKLLIWK